MREYSRQNPSLVPPNTNQVFEGWELKVPKRASALRQMVRFLSFKLARGLTLSIFERCVLYHLFSEIRGDQVRLEHLRVVERDLLILNRLHLLTLDPKPSESWYIAQISLLVPQTLSVRAVGGLDLASLVKEWIAWKPKKSRPAPKRYIGVGYKDKGHRRNITLDASPSWQEVAVSESSRLEMQNIQADFRWWNNIGTTPRSHLPFTPSG